MGNMMYILRKKELIDLSVPLATDFLPKLVTKAASSAIDKFQRKVSRRGAVAAGKGFTLLISNKDMGSITEVVESLENSGLLIDGVTETVKYEIKKQKVD